MSDQAEGLTLTLDCVLGAPPARVFAALTEPGELEQWWGPHGFTTSVDELDLAGGYRFSMRPPDGDVFHLSGEFVEVDPPTRLVYTFTWEEPTPDDRETVVRISLDGRGDTTVLSLSQGVFATEERLDLHRNGWTDALDTLRAVLARAGA